MGSAAAHIGLDEIGRDDLGVLARCPRRHENGSEGCRHVLGVGEDDVGFSAHQFSVAILFFSMVPKSISTPRPGFCGAKTMPFASTVKSSTSPYFCAASGSNTSKNSEFGIAHIRCRLATLLSELPPWWISKFNRKASAR